MRLLQHGDVSEAASHRTPPCRLSADAVNGAEFKKGKLSSALYVRAQVLLDRARYSPGEIDAKDGVNFKRALTAFAADHNLKADGRLTPDLWEALKQIGNDPAIINYTTTKADAEGPFLKEIPRKLEEQADLDRLGGTYTGRCRHRKRSSDRAVPPSAR